MYEYQAQITRVVDGDTVHARVDLGLDVRIDITLRLYGINAPELSTDAGKLARSWLIQRLADVHTVTIRTYKDKREKYGRYLATLLDGDADINAEMIAAGQAVVYLP